VVEDEYFIKRKPYPNSGFYSGIIYQAMGFRPEMFKVLLAIPRTVGWVAGPVAGRVLIQVASPDVYPAKKAMSGVQTSVSFENFPSEHVTKNSDLNH
jgi:hypothetical protein